MMKLTISAIEGSVDGESFVFVPMEYEDNKETFSGPEAAIFLRDLLKTLNIEFSIETLDYGSMEKLGYIRSPDNE